MKAERTKPSSDHIVAQGIPSQITPRPEEISTMALEVPPRAPLVGTPISKAAPKPSEPAPTPPTPPPPPPPPAPVEAPESSTMQMASAPRGRGRKDAATTCIYFRDADQCDAVRKLCTRNGGSMSAVFQQLSQGLLVAAQNITPGQRIIKVSVDVFI